MKCVLAGGAVFAASFLGLAAQASASAPQYPPQVPDVRLNLSITIINNSGTVNLSFIGCQIGEPVAVDFNNSTSVTQCTALGVGTGGATGSSGNSDAGAAFASLSAPATPGVFPVTASGLTSDVSATESVTVVPADQVAAVAGASGVVPAVARPSAAEAPAVAGVSGVRGSRQSLPATGTNNNEMLWIAGSALLAGLGLTGVALRRRQGPAAS